MKKIIASIFVILLCFAFAACNEQYYQFEVSFADTMGTVTVNGEAPSDKTYLSGSLVTVVATPKEGYEFVGYANEGEKEYLSSSTTYKVFITKNYNINAEFKKEQNVDIEDKLDAPVLSLVGSTLSWEAVEGAATYHIYIAQETTAASIISETSINLSLIIKLDGTYQIRVIAVNQTTASLASTISYTQTTIPPTPDPDGYEGTYYNSVNLVQTGTALRDDLRSLISITHIKILSYGDLRNYTIKSDTDPDNPNNIILFYCRMSIDGEWGGENRWNREHVWPQSQGWFGTSGAGADLHHIRPTDKGANSTRDNHPFGEVSGGTMVYTTGDIGKHPTNCYVSGNYFVPREEIRGDIARIIFYLLVRYSQADNYNITNVAQSMDMLLRWNAADPVDASEIHRNNAVFDIQHNRNPFIDYPSLANAIWG